MRTSNVLLFDPPICSSEFNASQITTNIVFILLCGKTGKTENDEKAGIYIGLIEDKENRTIPFYRIALTKCMFNYSNTQGNVSFLQ